MFGSALLKATVGAAFILCVSSPASAGCGVFKAVIKDVKVKKASGQTSPAAAGGSVCSGDSIAAGPDSRASVEMEDKNTLNVSPNTSIVIEAYEKKKVVLNVLGGKLRSSIAAGNKYDDKNTFQVKTKSAVAGVRGTDFLTSFSPSTGKTEVVTFSGRVDVGQAGPGGKIANAVSVGPGQKTEAAVGRAPDAPRPVPASELKQLNQSTTSNSAPGAAGAASSADSGGSTVKKDKGSDSDSSKGGDPNAKSDGGSAKSDGSAKSGGGSGASLVGGGAASSEKSATTSDGGRSPSSAANAPSTGGGGSGAIAAPALSASPSMVGGGDVSGDVKPAPVASLPNVAAAPAPPPVPQVVAPVLPVQPVTPPALDPSIVNAIQNSGPTKLHVRVCVNGVCG